jgi:hypothetical protein
MSNSGFSCGEIVFGLGLLSAGALVLTAAGESVTRAASDADAISDLRGLAAAGMLHVADQNGLLPPCNPKEDISGRNVGWHAKSNKAATLYAYLGDPSFLHNLGDDHDVKNYPEVKSESHNDYPSYGMNRQIERSRVLEMSQIQNPERKVWFAESGHRSSGQRKRTGLQSYVVDGRLPMDEAGVFPRRDGKGACVVYFDSRVELIEDILKSEVTAPLLAMDPEKALDAHWNL